MDLQKMQKMKEEFDKERGWEKFRASNIFVHLIEELGEIGRYINFEEKYKTKSSGHTHNIDKEELKREFAQVLMLFIHSLPTTTKSTLRALLKKNCSL